MKTPVKWSISTAFALLVLVVLSVLLTGHSMTEEKSQHGNTVQISDTAVTYIKDADITMRMPKDWKRFFCDTKEDLRAYMNKSKLVLLAAPDNWEYTIEVMINPSYSIDDIGSMEELGETQKVALISQVQDWLSHPLDTTYEITSDMTAEYVLYGNFTYLRTTYERKSTAYAEFDVVTDYVLLLGGKYIEFTCYYCSKEKLSAAQVITKLDASIVPIIESIEQGNKTIAYQKGNEDGFWKKLSSFTFSIWVFMIPLIYILLCGMKVVNPSYIPDAKEYAMLAEKGEDAVYKKWQDNPLSLENSKALLGFCAVLIVFHHIAQTVGAANASAFSILEHFGVGLVGMFFFFSGYGLMKSRRTKKDYLKGFFKKRMPGILIPFYVCIFLFILAALLTKTKMSVPELIGYFTGFILINTHMWYIVEIALFYTVFYLVFRFIKNERKALFVMGGFLLLFTIGSMLLCHGIYWFQGEWWYNTSFVFLVGMIFASKEETIFKAFKKHYKGFVALFGILFIVLNRVTNYMLRFHGYWTETMTDKGYDDKLMTLVPQLFMTIAFVILVVLILMKCKFDNPVLRFLGKISLELYLIHNLLLMYCRSIAGTGMYVLAVVVGSILLATLLHMLDTWILCKLYGKPVPKAKPIRPYFEAAKKRFAWSMRMKLQFIRRHPKRAMTYVFRTVVCTFISFVSIAPIYILYINATRTNKSLIRGITFIPEGEFMNNLMDFKNYASQIAQGLGMAIFRTCFIAGASCLLAVYFGCMCAYGFEVFEFRGKKQLWRIVIAALMFSQVASFWGFYRLVIKLGLLNTMIPLIIPSIATPSVAFFMRMYLRTLHLNEIVEAARIDGCSELGIYNRIILPAVKPAFSLQIIFTFVTTWNNSFMQSMILQKPHQKTISMILRVFAGDKSIGSNPLVYVTVLLTTIPPVVVYILFSKSIVSRIVLGAVKE